MRESSEKCLNRDCNFIGGDYYSLTGEFSLFHSRRPKAFSLSLLNLLIFTALINAHSNYGLIEITVSYFIKNPLFESFQMGVHRLVS